MRQFKGQEDRGSWVLYASAALGGLLPLHMRAAVVDAGGNQVEGRCDITGVAEDVAAMADAMLLEERKRRGGEGGAP